MFQLLLFRLWSPISIVTSLRVNKTHVIPRRRINFPQGTERMTALTWWYGYGFLQIALQINLFYLISMLAINFSAHIFKFNKDSTSNWWNFILKFAYCIQTISKQCNISKLIQSNYHIIKSWLAIKSHSVHPRKLYYYLFDF